MTTDAAENDEIQMTKEFPNDEAGFGPFVIRPSSLIRHSTFVLRHLPETLRRSHRLARDRDGTFSRPFVR